MSKFQLEDTPLQKARYSYVPKLPASLLQDITKIGVQLGPTEAPTGSSQKILQEIFKITYGKPLVTFVPGTNDKLGKKLAVGFILSGGQAPGGHNVIAGLFDGLKKGNPESKLYGFLDGPGGLIKNKTVEITAALIDKYRNTGGFDMIGSGRTKIETPEQFAASLKNAQALDLDAVVIIGGDDSNTNAALLAEYFEAHADENKAAAKKVAVVGVPKTIDGDLKNEYIETSFGFDTACKVYSDLIGNIQRDTVSSQKHWHFIKLMGRSASHITLECALQTQANVALISEEAGAKNLTLDQIVDEISGSIVARASDGQDFGTVLIPEGLVEFVPEMKVLISELNDILALNATEFGKLGKAEEQRAWLGKKLSPGSAKVYASLPALIADELVLERDPHGNVIVSSIETEKLLMDMTATRLAELKRTGKYTGTFSSMTHFFGFEGRCAFPTNFDADYCYSLGFSAFVLVASGLTGYMACVRNLVAPAEQWVAGGIPLTMMMDMEQRKGAQKPVIKKALVELKGEPFKALEVGRATWAVKTSFLFPGAIQYWGPKEVCDQPTKTLVLEQKKK